MHRKPHPPVLNRQYQDGQKTNQNQMKNTCPFYIVFQVLKVILIKISKIQPPDLLYLLVFISFYIGKYNFSQIIRTSFNIGLLQKKTKYGGLRKYFFETPLEFLVFLLYSGKFQTKQSFTHRNSSKLCCTPQKF